MTIIKDYLEYTSKWKTEYGEKTLVLMQVGSFYEAYGLIDNNNIISGSNIVEFSEINDMAVSKKNICVGKERVVMAGFGLPQLDKYVKKMQDNGYTIVVYSQDTQAKNTTRSLTGIFSPGTYFSNDTKELSNNITSIWIHYSSNKISGIGEQITIGISNIDIYTGKTSIFEFTSAYYHNPCTYDELERYISIYNPNECVIISNLEEYIIDDIINFTNIRCNKIHKILFGGEKKDSIKFAENAEKQIYQKEIISRFYPNDDECIILNDLQEYCIAIQSFTFLLDFVFRHNPNLVSRLAKPNFENYTDRLILANHSLKQLNILGDNRYTGKFSCVSNLLNNCITPMGKRNFHYNLLNPITNIDELNKSYNITEHMISNEWESYRHKLDNIRDIEKLKRKLIIKKITPKDFTNIYSNVNDIENIYKKCLNDETLLDYLNSNKNCDIISKCNSLKIMLDDFFELDKAVYIDDISVSAANVSNINHLFFIKTGLFNKIDAGYRKALESRQQIDCIREYLSDLIKTHEKSVKTTEFVKLHETPKQEPSLIATKRRVAFLKKSLESKEKNVILKYKSDYSNKEEEYIFNISEIDYSPYNGNNSNVIITSPQIRSIANDIINSKNELVSILDLYYNEFVNKFIEKSDMIDDLIKFVINIDILQCKCYIAEKYNYCKPNIEKRNKSFVDFTGIRHCLIEHLNTRETYVSNDIDLGYNKNGILLYGTNAVGKTSLIKSIGITVIMAQAGLFVPCTNFTYHPYNYLFTRILGNDNIFKGLSTFAVEMSELRTILQFSNKDSLILGDELCSGTESDSALSIFVSGLEELHKKESTFIFATHFHEVVKYDEIKELNNLELYHMEVFYNNKERKLVYDRKLKKGPGDSMYGLEVCKSLDLPYDFLERAHSLRVKYNNVYKNVLDLPASKYNSKKIRNLCEMCRVKMGSEIHHLEQQKNADKNNFLPQGFHKNHVANLINVCEECHHNFHKK